VDPSPQDPSRVDADRIDEILITAMLEEQFPRWSHLPVRFVQEGGNDHRMFRLGHDLVVRVPRAPGYVPQVEKEQRWLPVLGPTLPLPIPLLRGAGRASELFPAPWSIYEWREGTPASRADIGDRIRFAEDLAQFLVALRGVDAAAGPRPGLHSAFRGGPLEHWDNEMADLLRRLNGDERDRAEAVWRDALAAPFDGQPVWVHGDVAAANLLVRNRRLDAVLDFGCAAVGDPACDTVILWTLFSGASQAAFRKQLQVDEATWTRGRGWALWKALIMITNIPAHQRRLARHVLEQLLDHPE